MKAESNMLDDAKAETRLAAISVLELIAKGFPRRPLMVFEERRRTASG